MRNLRAAIAGRCHRAVRSAAGAAQAQTKITVGKIVGGIGLHIPSYIAMDKGFFKEEGLDARLDRIAGQADDHGRADRQPRLRADPLRRRAGGADSGASSATSSASRSSRSGSSSPSRRSRRSRTSSGKTLGYARVGAADYDEGATTLERFFNMKVGRDYKVIQFQGEPERIAALANGDIAARAGLGAARLPGQAGRLQRAAADRRLPAARRRRVLVHRRFLQEESRDGEEVHPRHRQGRDVLPRQQGRLLSPRMKEHLGVQERRGGGRAVGRAAQHLRAPSCRPISTARFSNRAGST